MNFETFWADPRIPPEMKRCGKPPVRHMLEKTGADYETVLASLPAYTASKPADQLYCHLSTYISQERYDVDHAAISDSPGKDMSFDERREVGERLVANKGLRVV